MSETESKQIFMKKFNELLNESGITQKEISIICGASTSTVSTWSKGINMPRMDKIEKLANHFGLPKSYFIEDIPAPKYARPLTFDDFTYAMHEEGKTLTDENKKKLLEMAEFFRQQQEKNQD